MWPGLPKGVLYTHSFRSHLSPSFDRYNNRPTVRACTIAKSSTVCFYWGLIHGPVWRPRMLGWSVNDPNLPARQTDGRESPQDWLVRLGIDLATFWDVWSWKQPELKPFGHKEFRCVYSSGSRRWFTAATAPAPTHVILYKHVT